MPEGVGEGGEPEAASNILIFFFRRLQTSQLALQIWTRQVLLRSMDLGPPN